MVLHPAEVQKRCGSAGKFQGVLLQVLFHHAAVFHHSPAGVGLHHPVGPAASGDLYRLLPHPQKPPCQTCSVVAVRHRQPGKMHRSQCAAACSGKPLCQSGVQPVLFRHLQLCPLPVQLPQLPQGVLFQCGGGLAEDRKAPLQPLPAHVGNGRLIYRHHHKVRLHGDALLHRGGHRCAVFPVHLFCLFRCAAEHGAHLEPPGQRLRHPQVEQRSPARTHNKIPQLSHGVFPPEYVFAAPAQTALHPAAG